MWQHRAIYSPELEFSNQLYDIVGMTVLEHSNHAVRGQLGSTKSLATLLLSRRINSTTI